MAGPSSAWPDTMARQQVSRPSVCCEEGVAGCLLQWGCYVAIQGDEASEALESSQHVLSILRRFCPSALSPERGALCNLSPLAPSSCWEVLQTAPLLFVPEGFVVCTYSPHKPETQFLRVFCLFLLSNPGNLQSTCNMSLCSWSRSPGLGIQWSWASTPSQLHSFSSCL